MVRLTCVSKTCGHEWKETKSQRESEHVRCPRCDTHHHSHSQPINPPEKLVYNDIPRTYRIPSKPLIPYEKRELYEVDMFGKTVKVVKS